MNRTRGRYDDRSIGTKCIDGIVLVLFLIMSGFVASCGQGGSDSPASIATSYLTYNYYDSDGLRIREVRYYGFGRDGILMTEDDEVSYYTAYSYDAGGNEIESVRYVGSGADGAWFTADDEIFLYTISAYDEFENRTASVLYIGPGLDGLWRTSDDESIAVSTLF